MTHSDSPREQRQRAIDDKGYLTRLDHYEGTSPNKKNKITCLGCLTPYTVGVNVLFGKKRKTKFPGCDDCQFCERVERQQTKLNQMGKNVDLIPSLYEGTGFHDENTVICRVCLSSYTINGNRLFSRSSGESPNCHQCRLSRLQQQIDEKGYLLRLISSNGTQQTDDNDVICLGCNLEYTLKGHRIFRTTSSKETKHPGCEGCQKIERSEKAQKNLDEMGKKVSIIPQLYEGTTLNDSNWIRCHNCDSDPYKVSGKALFRRGSPTPGCEYCLGEKKKQRGRELGRSTSGPRYDKEEAQRKFEDLNKPGRGKILEWNGTSIGTGENQIAAPAVFLCDCGKRVDTTGPSIMASKVRYNGCSVCGPKAQREANLKYDLKSAKAAIKRNQKRDVLDLSTITTFHSVHDRVDLTCTKHDSLCKNKHLWALIQGTSPCKFCRAEMIGAAHAAGWIETEEKMRKIEGDHIKYVDRTYVSRQQKMLKRCSKNGHNIDTEGQFWQSPKQTILQGSTCPDCGAETGAEKRRLTTDVLRDQYRIVHGDRYNYPELEAEYENDNSKISIECPSHGIYKTQSSGMHKAGQGCPQCAKNGKRSKIEVQLMFEVGQFFPNWNIENIVVEDIEERIGPVDGILSTAPKLILEFDGYWYHCKDDRVENDKRKTSILVKNGWVVYRVRQGELPEIEKAVNVQVQGVQNLKIYADDVIQSMIDNNILTMAPEIERYLQSNNPWRENESRDWYYANCCTKKKSAS